MKVYFLDTSALVKAFVAEEGSQGMIDLLERTADQFKAASSLTFVELRSAIRRRFFSGDSSQLDSDLATELARNEARRVILHPVSESVLSAALRLIDHQKLCTLDAIQLSTALLARDLAEPARKELIFVAADKKLLSAAKAEGLQTWNPAEERSAGSR